jgi:dTDP-4-amino-4,6-dideoxygalactose transaminase
MVDLRPLLRRARPAIAARIAEMHGARHYILGAQVASFEQELATAFGARLAIGAGTGTAALELALRAAGRPAEVVVPALTSLFTAQAALAAGARLRIADVDDETLLLTAATAQAVWTPATAAVIAVHLYGRPCELGPLARLCGGSAILVQDACQAHGACHRGRPLTAYSPLVCYSFYPTKNLGCLGDGGAVLTSSAALERRLRLLRDGGRSGGQVARIPALNSRLDEIHACHLRALLPHLDHWNAHRRQLAQLYRDALAGTPGVRLLADAPESVQHLFVIRVRRREKLRAHLAGAGIQTGVHYPTPLHLHPAFRQPGVGRGALPVAERACREILSLPIGAHVRPADVERVARDIRRFYQ